MTREEWEAKQNSLKKDIKYVPTGNPGEVKAIGYMDDIEEKKSEKQEPLNTPEAWEKSIRNIEHEIGNPSKWTMENYNKLQNKLNQYKNWRENTPEGKAVKDNHNVPGEYIVSLPPHLQKNKKQQ
jgi:hypothetical protein